MKNVILLSLSLFFVSFGYSYGAGVYYDGTAQTHCTEWSNKRLKWPQTILGKFSAKCRIRATRLSKGPVVCRLKRNYIDPETDERMCIYQRGGYNLGDATVSMPKTEKCLKTYSCKRD